MKKFFDPYVICSRKRLGVEFEVLSAHRQPKELSSALDEKSYDAVVAGAGLSAHLPGVVASQVNTPVFGVPVAAHLGGLDAFFSIFQMPFGVPVMSCVPGKFSDIVDFLRSYRKIENNPLINIAVDPVLLNYEYVNLELDRTKKYLEEQGLACQVGEAPRKDCRNIRLVREVDDICMDSEVACLHVPLLDKSTLQSAAKALDLFYLMQTEGCGSASTIPVTPSHPIVGSTFRGGGNDEFTTYRSQGQCQKYQKPKRRKRAVF